MNDRNKNQAFKVITYIKKHTKKNLKESRPTRIEREIPPKVPSKNMQGNIALGKGENSSCVRYYFFLWVGSSFGWPYILLAALRLAFNISGNRQVWIRGKQRGRRGPTHAPNVEAAELMKFYISVSNKVIRQMKRECIKKPSIHSHNLNKIINKESRTSHGHQTFLFSPKVRNERNIHSRYQVRNLWLEENLSESPIVTSLFQRKCWVSHWHWRRRVLVVRYIFLVVHGALAVLRLAFKRKRTSVNRWKKRGRIGQHMREKNRGGRAYEM